jgi:hypothetical protein
MRPVWRPPVVVSCPRRPSPAQGLIKARGNPAMRRGNLVTKGTRGRRRSCLVPCASESGKEEACEHENSKLWGEETGRSMEWSGRRGKQCRCEGRRESVLCRERETGEGESLERETGEGESLERGTCAMGLTVGASPGCIVVCPG